MQLVIISLLALAIHGHVAAAAPAADRPGQLERAKETPERSSVGSAPSLANAEPIPLYDRRDESDVLLARRGEGGQAGNAPEQPAAKAAGGKKRKTDHSDETPAQRKRREDSNKRAKAWRDMQKQNKQAMLDGGGEEARQKLEQERKEKAAGLKEWRANRQKKAEDGDEEAKERLAQEKAKKVEYQRERREELLRKAEAGGEEGEEARRKLEGWKASSVASVQKKRFPYRTDELLSGSLITGEEYDDEPTATEFWKPEG